MGCQNKKSPDRLVNPVSSFLRKRRINRLLKILGPGLITGAADDDPSGVITYSQAGAGFGLSFLWTFPLMFPMLLAVQGTCSSVGAVTGQGLAAIIKKHYSKKLLYVALLLVVVANTINIGANLGAMAATTQLFVDVPFMLLTVLYAVIIIVLVVFVSYRKYVKILKWLALTLFAYPIVAFMTKQDWGMIWQSTFATLPTINAETIYIFVGILGTTISPYCFFWDSSQTVEEEIRYGRLGSTKSKPPKISRKFLFHLKLDNFFGMALSEIIGWFIVVTCASVLFSNGITQIETAADAASALEPLMDGFPYAGLMAKIIFSFGIIGVGLLAVPVLAGSSAYAICETFGWREGLRYKFKRATAFYIIIIMAIVIGLAVNLVHINPIQTLIFTAVFNGVAAVPLIYLIAKIGRNRKIMGQYRNGPITNLLMWITFSVMGAAALALFYFLFTS